MVEHACDYPVTGSNHQQDSFCDPSGWRDGLISLCRRLDAGQRLAVAAVAIAGTSGTLLLCHPDGSLLAGEQGLALPYWQACPEQSGAVGQLLSGSSSIGAAIANSATSSLARALRLLARSQAAGLGGELLLRHQADWLMGWLLADWRWGEEGNNLRLGWDLQTACWAGRLDNQPWSSALPQIRPSGARLGRLSSAAANLLDLPRSCQVVSGSTDANAAVLAADPGEGDGITVLGTTLVLKQFVAAPIHAPGVSCHRVAGRWLLGGASNAGAGILRRFYSDRQIRELSRQIDPDQDTGLMLRPLPGIGERFPVDDPQLAPILEPRPTSDALYLQALLEGLTRIEQAGWQRLQEFGAPAIDRLITLGGGARNPQWRRLRQRMLQRPIFNRPRLSAARGMALLARSAISPATQNGPHTSPPPR